MKDEIGVVGYYSAILTFGLALVTFGIAIFTPPFSGPLCTDNCFTYPYADIGSRFPRDYYWMYPAILLTLSYVVLMACIRRRTSADKKIFGDIGFAFALIAAAFLLSDYFIQISVIQPSLLNGEMEGISLWTQFNPHGIFIAFEELGFFMMSLALLFMAPSFTGPTLAERFIRWIFTLSFLLTIGAFIWISLQYGIFREYRFEIASISIVWLSLIVSGPFLIAVFKRSLN